LTSFAGEVKHYLEGLRGTIPEDFVLPFHQDNTGNWTLYDNYSEIHEWTLAYGTYRTLEQTRWFVVLMHHRGHEPCRVVGRLFFEDSLPICGVELKSALEASVRHGGLAMEVKRGVLQEMTAQPQFQLF
jgi:hypothetical protein